MQAVQAYFDAHAPKFMSSPGKTFLPDDAQGGNPLGPQFGGEKPGEGYHGYHYKILAAQGKDAPGTSSATACAPASPWSPGRSGTGISA